jgi:hypothetical protein
MVGVGLELTERAVGPCVQHSMGVIPCRHVPVRVWTLSLSRLRPCLVIGRGPGSRRRAVSQGSRLTVCAEFEEADAMAILFECSSCKAAYEIDDDLASNSATKRHSPRKYTCNPMPGAFFPTPARPGEFLQNPYSQRATSDSRQHLIKRVITAAPGSKNETLGSCVPENGFLSRRLSRCHCSSRS